MRDSAASTRDKSPAECLERAAFNLTHFANGEGQPMLPHVVASEAMLLGNAIAYLLAPLRTGRSVAGTMAALRTELSRAEAHFRVSFPFILPAMVANRGFGALRLLVSQPTTPIETEEAKRWRGAIADAHYFQNALHNYAIGFERDLPTGSEMAGGPPASEVVSHAEKVIVFPGREAKDRTVFDDIFGDGAPDR